MTAATDRESCGVRWCDEVGDHSVHRLYLESIQAESGRWMLGVNVIRPGGAATAIELTSVPRHGRSTVVRLGTREAELLGEAIGEAIDRIRRRVGRDGI